MLQNQNLGQNLSQNVAKKFRNLANSIPQKSKLFVFQIIVRKFAPKKRLLWAQTDWSTTPSSMMLGY
jgi:hypothetical protein